MVWNLVLPALGSVAGALIGKKSGEKIAERQISEQEEFAREGISWRVADAKKAGVHPLFALGAQLPSFNPVSVMDESAAYAQVGGELGARAAEYIAKRQEKPAAAVPGKYVIVHKRFDDKGEPYEEAELVSAPEYAEHMQFKGIDLEHRRIAQDIEESKARMEEMQARANKERAAALPDPIVGLDAQEYTPDQVVSPRGKEPWVRAGRHAGWTEFDLDNGFRAVFPSANSLSESLEALESSTVLKAAIIGYNVRRYGAGWLKQAAQMFPGVFSE